MLAKPQRELQHVPDILGLLPLGQLIDPGRVELRPAQSLRLMRGIDRGGRPVRPDQPLAPRLPDRTPVGGRTGQDAALAEHHHLAHLVEGLADQGHAMAFPGCRSRGPLDQAAHPFRPGAGLARPAPAHDHPGFPVALGGQLVRQSPELEQPGQAHQCVLRQPAQEFLNLLRPGGGKPGGARSRLVRRRGQGCPLRRRPRCPCEVCQP